MADNRPEENVQAGIDEPQPLPFIEMDNIDTGANAHNVFDELSQNNEVGGQITGENGPSSGANVIPPQPVEADDYGADVNMIIAEAFLRLQQCVEVGNGGAGTSEINEEILTSQCTGRDDRGTEEDTPTASAVVQLLQSIEMDDRCTEEDTSTASAVVQLPQSIEMDDRGTEKDTATVSAVLQHQCIKMDDRGAGTNSKAINEESHDQEFPSTSMEKRNTNSTRKFGCRRVAGTRKVLKKWMYQVRSDNKVTIQTIAESFQIQLCYQRSQLHMTQPQTTPPGKRNPNMKSEEESTSQASATAEEPVETASVNSDDRQDIDEPGAVEPPRETKLSTSSQMLITSDEGRSQSQDAKYHEEFVNEEADLENDGQNEWNSHSGMEENLKEKPTAKRSSINTVRRTETIFYRGGGRRAGAQRGGRGRYQRGSRPFPNRGISRGGYLPGGTPRGGAPRGGAPRGGAPRGGAPRGGAPRGGAQRRGASPRGTTRDGASEGRFSFRGNSMVWASDVDDNARQGDNESPQPDVTSSGATAYLDEASGFVESVARPHYISTLTSGELDDDNAMDGVNYSGAAPTTSDVAPREDAVSTTGSPGINQITNYVDDESRNQVRVVAASAAVISAAAAATVSDIRAQYGMSFTPSVSETSWQAYSRALTGENPIPYPLPPDEIHKILFKKNSNYLNTSPLDTSQQFFDGAREAAHSTVTELGLVPKSRHFRDVSGDNQSSDDRSSPCETGRIPTSYGFTLNPRTSAPSLETYLNPQVTVGNSSRPSGPRRPDRLLYKPPGKRSSNEAEDLSLQGNVPLENSLMPPPDLPLYRRKRHASRSKRTPKVPVTHNLATTHVAMPPSETPPTLAQKIMKRRLTTSVTIFPVDANEPEDLSVRRQKEDDEGINSPHSFGPESVNAEPFCPVSKESNTEPFQPDAPDAPESVNPDSTEAIDYSASELHNRDATNSLNPVGPEQFNLSALQSTTISEPKKSYNYASAKSRRAVNAVQFGDGSSSSWQTQANIADPNRYSTRGAMPVGVPRQSMYVESANVPSVAIGLAYAQNDSYGRRGRSRYPPEAVYGGLVNFPQSLYENMILQNARANAEAMTPSGGSYGTYGSYGSYGSYGLPRPINPDTRNATVRPLAAAPQSPLWTRGLRTTPKVLGNYPSNYNQNPPNSQQGPISSWLPRPVAHYPVVCQIPPPAVVLCPLCPNGWQKNNEVLLASSLEQQFKALVVQEVFCRVCGGGKG